MEGEMKWRVLRGTPTCTVELVEEEFDSPDDAIEWACADLKCGSNGYLVVRSSAVQSLRVPALLLLLGPVD